ncbi:hypothetical protein [Sphingobacterium hungaricum]
MIEQSRKPENEDEDDDFMPNDFAFDKDKGSYELDVNDNDPDWDHPSDYETIAEGAKDDDSTYDNSNPLVGDEYADREDLIDDEFNDEGIRIVGKKDLKISKLDEELSRTEEDYRDDLDEEGYPKK